MNKKAIRSRRLSFESLENRELLSVSQAEYVEIRSMYADLNLSAYTPNIIEVGASTFALTEAGLRAAINQASYSSGSLIVCRTTDTQNTITLSGTELAITNGIAIVSYGYSPLTIDANQQSRVFNITGNYSNTYSVALGGLTITGGVADDGNGGGGILCDSSSYASLTVTNCTIYGNSAEGSGGGIYHDARSLAVTNSIIVGNAAEAGQNPTDGSGGGIYYYFNGTNTPLTLVNNTISGNSAALSGGGVYVEGAAVIVNCDISKNVAIDAGGGMYIGGYYYGSQTTISNSTIADNTADYGGGIYNEATLSVSNSTIAGNSATLGILPNSNVPPPSGYGGGIFLAGNGQSFLTNSILAGNAATVGGGLYADSSFTVINCTIAGNEATQSGGGFYSSGNPNANFNNTLIVRNVAGSVYGAPDVAGYVYGNNNLIGNGYGQNALSNGSNGNIVGGDMYNPNPNPLNPVIDPKFVNFTPYAVEDWSSDLWKEWDLRLADGSPAIDSGSNYYATTNLANPLLWDFSRKQRIVNGIVDIGAHEYTGMPLVESTAPGNFRSTAKSKNSITLRWDAAAGANGYEIQYREFGSMEWTTLSVVGTTAFFADLDPGTAYEFQIRTLGGEGKSAWSSTLSVATSPLVLPSAPLNFQITSLTDDSVALVWNPTGPSYPPGWAPNAIGYEVEVRTSTDPTWTSVASPMTTSLTVDNLDASTAYAFRVRGWNNDGYSAWTTIYITTDVAPTAPINGYNAYEWNLLFDQGYDPTDTMMFSWTPVNGELRLTSVNAQNAGLTGTLDLSNCTELTSVQIGSMSSPYLNQLTSLDVSGCTNLQTLVCQSNRLVSLNLFGCRALQTLLCANNQLSELDVSACTNLRTLNCGTNKLTSLDLTGLTQLESLTCFNNQLTVLDVSDNRLLQNVNVANGNLPPGTANNQLTALDLSGCTLLSTLVVDNNRLTYSSLKLPTGFSNSNSIAWNLQRPVFGTFVTARQGYEISVPEGFDLSAEAVFSDGIMEYETTYTWYFQYGGVVDPSWYLESEPGKFTFQGMPIPPQGLTVYCVIYNPAFYFTSLRTEDVTILAPVSSNYNAHDWQKVEDQNLQNYAKWVAIDGELRLYSIDMTAYSGSSGYTLDLSGCAALKEVQASRYYLQTLNLSGCTALTDLSFDSTGSYSMMTLNLSGCTALKQLDVSGSGTGIGLSTLDVSGCTALKELRCRSGSTLASLNLTGCTALEVLDCYAHRMTSLNLTGLTALTDLQCNSNYLVTLNVSGLTALKNLTCNNSHQLTSIKAVGCTALEVLECINNSQLAALDVSGCTSLTNLRCYYNTNYNGITQGSLTSLNVSGCAKLQNLECYNNQLSTLDISDCKALYTLNCSGNQLTSLDASLCTVLYTLYCAGNQLTSLDIAGLSALRNLNCQDNELTSLDLSWRVPSHGMLYLNCDGNRLTYSAYRPPANDASIGYTGSGLWSTQRWEIGTYTETWPGSGSYVYEVSIAQVIDLSSEAVVNGTPTVYTWYFPGGSPVGPSYYYVEVEPGKFVFDVSSSAVGSTVYCVMSNSAFNNSTYTSSPLRTVDVTFTAAVQSEYNAHDWQVIDNRNLWSSAKWANIDGELRLTELNINSGPSLGLFDLSGCTALTSLTIQSVSVTALNLSGCTALTQLNVADLGLLSLNLSGCTALEVLRCNNNQLTSLDVSGLANLTELRCGNNQQLTSLDVSGLTALKILICEGNAQLATLNVSGCTALEDLRCSGSRLALLDVSDCTNLKRLACGYNQLTSLDLSNCTALQSLYCQYNELTSLDLSNCWVLTEWNIDFNKLWYSTLLLPPGEQPYGWATQRPEIGVYNADSGRYEVAAVGVDLSSEAEFSGTPTTFIWYYANGYAIAPELVTALEPGKFTFDISLLDEAIYCEMMWFSGSYIRTADVTLVATQNDVPLSTPGNFHSLGKTKNAVGLAWDVVDVATGYEIQYRETGAAHWETALVTTGVSWMFTDLEADTAYEFQVRALRSIDESPWSSSIFVTTDALVLPTTPTGLQTTSITTSSISLMWAPAANALAYDVGYSFDGEEWDSIRVFDTQTTFSGLAPATTGEFKVIAVNDDGFSDWSTTISAATEAIQLTAPTLTVGTPTATAVPLSWTTISEATGYVIEKSNDNGNSWSLVETIANGSTISTTATGLTASTPYLFRIMAIGTGAYSDSDWSTTQSVATLVSGIPQVTAVGQPAGVLLTWEPITGATAYRVYRLNDAGANVQLTANITATTYVDYTARIGVTETYSVIALNGSWSDSQPVTATALPGTDIPQVTAVGQPAGVLLTWAAVSGATAYRVYRLNDAGANVQLTANITATTYVDYAARIGVAETYSVIALNGTWSDSQPVTATALPGTGVPQVTAIGQSANVSLSWAVVADATAYRVYRLSDTGSYVQLAANITATTYVDYAARIGVTETYSVIALSGSWSDSQPVTATALPGTGVPQVTAIGQSASVSLSWAAVSGATAYRVYRLGDTGSYVQLTANITETTYIDYAARIGVTETYSVIALNGTWSDSKPVTATALPGTGVPQVTAVGQPGSVSLTWDAIAGATAYRVYRLNDAGAYVQLTANITATTFVDDTARTGVTETYSVIALNGTWSDSKPVTATALPSNQLAVAFGLSDIDIDELFSLPIV